MQMGFAERIGITVIIGLLVVSIFVYHWYMDRRQRRMSANAGDVTRQPRGVEREPVPAVKRPR